MLTALAAEPLARAQGIAQVAIVFSVASVLCRCGVRVHGPGAAVLALYRQHRALARQHEQRQAARPPARVATITRTRS
jgi:hypothetical protein